MFLWVHKSAFDLFGVSQIYRYSLILLCVSSWGCSLYNSGIIETNSETQNGQVTVSKPEDEALEAPIKLSVAQAFYSPQGLNIKIRVDSLAEIASSDVIVKVMGLHEGQVIESHYKKLDEVTEKPRILKDQAIALNFVLQNKAISEYQILGSWGDDARTLLAEESVLKSKTQPTLATLTAPEVSARASLASVPHEAVVEKNKQTNEFTGHIADESKISGDSLADLKIASLTIERIKQPCGKTDCDLLYTINALVENRTSASYKDIKLAVGFVWVEKGVAPVVPENFIPKINSEEVFELPDKVLDSGKSKKLQIALDRAVPVVPGGEFVPYLRMLSASKVD